MSEVFKKNPPNKCIVGQDVAGVIVKVGSAVTNVKLDDAVVGKMISTVKPRLIVISQSNVSIIKGVW